MECDWCWILESAVWYKVDHAEAAAQEVASYSKLCSLWWQLILSCVQSADVHSLYHLHSSMLLMPVTPVIAPMPLWSQFSACSALPTLHSTALMMLTSLNSSIPHSLHPEIEQSTPSNTHCCHSVNAWLQHHNITTHHRAHAPSTSSEPVSFSEDHYMCPHTPRIHPSSSIDPNHLCQHASTNTCQFVLLPASSFLQQSSTKSLTCMAPTFCLSWELSSSAISLIITSILTEYILPTYDYPWCNIWHQKHSALHPICFRQASTL